MLYLIRTFGRGKNKTSLKVGYTENTSTRFSSYRVHNPFFELVSSREGGREEELKLQLYLTSLGKKEKFMNEWFLDCDGVLQHFHDRTDRIDREIWKNRETLFSVSDFKGTLKKTIYEELKDKFGYNPAKYKIDSEWLRVENMKYLKENSTRYKKLRY